MLDIFTILDDLSNCVFKLYYAHHGQTKHFTDLYPARGDDEYYCVHCEVMREGLVAPLLDPSAGERGKRVYCLNRMVGVTVLLPAFKRP